MKPNVSKRIDTDRDLLHDDGQSLSTTVSYW